MDLIKKVFFKKSKADDIIGLSSLGLKKMTGKKHTKTFPSFFQITLN